MAYITYDKYAGMGYSAVPEAAFTRWAIMAEQMVRKHTFNRITDENITETNRFGVCSIIDLLYTGSSMSAFVVNGDNGQAQYINSFSNQNYSESYASLEEMQAANDKAITDIIGLYFTPEQRQKWAWA
jgi:hypothetical protein